MNEKFVIEALLALEDKSGLWNRALILSTMRHCRELIADSNRVNTYAFLLIIDAEIAKMEGK